MKKMNFLKIAFTVVLAVSFGVAFGQEIEGGAGVRLTVDETVDQYVTVNKAMPYHVMPDIYFNPGYTSGGGWAVLSDFAWSFSVDPASFTISDPAVINPDVTIGTVGDFVLNVVETSADGCAGTTTSLNIHVLAAPDMNFSVADIVDNCGPLAAQNVLFNIVDNSATDYLVDWTYDVDELAADKSTLLDERVDLDATNTDDAFAANGNGLTLVNQAFPVLNNRVTRYTFTLTGINDAVSRVSDYVAPNGRAWPIATFTDYASTGTSTWTVTVLPAPTTGPIYHIAN